jgi:hypothetical protein
MAINEKGRDLFQSNRLTRDLRDNVGLAHLWKHPAPAHFASKG